VNGTDPESNNAIILDEDIETEDTPVLGKRIGVLFCFWGRRNVTSLFTLQAAETAKKNPLLDVSVSISRQNDIFDKFSVFGNDLVPIDTFGSDSGAVLNLWRIPQIRRRLRKHIQSNNISIIVDMMPHIWSPFITSALKGLGAAYCVVAHDAVSHPGDNTGWVRRISEISVRRADVVIALSKSVAEHIAASGKVVKSRINVIALPDIRYSHSLESAARRHGGATLRLLFIGRIMRYKGLELLIEAVELNKSRGFRVDLGVFGEGALGSNKMRLSKLNAEVVNRWLTDEEVGEVLLRFDAVIACHTESSQSGVVSAAFGAGMPVIATPVGGLMEQVADGVTGVIAKSLDAEALADAMMKIADPRLYDQLCRNISSEKSTRSMEHFVQSCVGAGVAACCPLHHQFK
jgi:glycosyltransferase involved in cell wall biosynthesis